MRLVGVLLLLVAGGLGYLTFVDRMSPTALSVVELESQLGVPLSVIAAAAGILAIALSFRGSRKAAPASSQPRTHKPAAPRVVTPSASGDWVSEAIQRARALQLEDGVIIKFDEGSGIPFSLLLDRVTPEVERRSLDAFTTFLSAIPTPQRAKVIFIGKNATGVPRQHTVKGSLRRVFHATHYQVIPQQNWVDVLFFAPDPCWADRPFLFLDQ